MKTIVVAALLALSFTTGFTCSKNTPAEPAAQTAAPAQEQMAQPAAPAEGQPAAATAPAAPTEGQPAAATAPAAPAAPTEEKK